MTTPMQPDPLAVQFSAEADRLVAENTQGFQDLKKLGIQFDMGVLLTAQIECLSRTIAEAMGPVEGARFVQLARLRWEQAIEREIATAKSQGTKHQIAAGGSFSPGMIRELARATGTFGGRG